MLFAHCVDFPVVLVPEVPVSEHNTFLMQSAGILSPAQDCLHALTVMISLLLSGKAHSWLSPWLAGAPLTALRKKDSGVRLIADGEVLRH